MGDFQSQPRSQPKFMEATISVICNKFKVLKNGESPIMVRVAKDGKRSMKSLGVSVNPLYWDFAKNFHLGLFSFIAVQSGLVGDFNQLLNLTFTRYFQKHQATFHKK